MLLGLSDMCADLSAFNSVPFLISKVCETSSGDSMLDQSHVYSNGGL